VFLRADAGEGSRITAGMAACSHAALTGSGQSGGLCSSGRVRGVFALLLAAGLLFSQRADRATITGIVTDPSGMPIAWSAMRIVDNNTGVETKLETNDAGVYT
jgi:hypothetical protein